MTTISEAEVRAARSLRRELAKQLVQDEQRDNAALREIRRRAMRPTKTVANAWSEEEIATLRRVYPKAGAARVAKILGRTFVAVGDKAHRLGLTTRRGKRPDSSAGTDRIDGALRAARERGLSIDEIDVVARLASKRTAITTVSRLVVAGRIFASANRQHRRYFSTRQQAEIWDRFLRPRTQREIREAKVRGADPAAAPMQIHPDFKLTVAPPMQQVLRTNTHSMY